MINNRPLRLLTSQIVFERYKKRLSRLFFDEIHFPKSMFFNIVCNRKIMKNRCTKTGNNKTYLLLVFIRYSKSHSLFLNAPVCSLSICSLPTRTYEFQLKGLSILTLFFTPFYYTIQPIYFYWNEFAQKRFFEMI